MSLATPPCSFLATRRGKLTLALLCAIAFLDFADADAPPRQLDDHRFLRKVAQVITKQDNPSLLGMMLPEARKK